MMTSPQNYVLQGKRKLRELASDLRVHLYLRSALFFLAGFGLSAASLRNVCLPLPLGLLCACSGWSAVLTAAGGCLGYWVFWGSAGYQGMLWLAAGLVIVLLLADRRITAEAPLLMPAAAALIVSAAGVVFQAWFSDTTAVGNYLIRVCLSGGSVWVFRQVMAKRNPIAEWLCYGLGVLALAQIAPIKGVSLGFVAAGALAVTGAFPAVALAGLALDIAGICRVPMTAALCGSYLIRFLPKYPRWLGAFVPALSYVFVSSITGTPEIAALPGLVAGGLVGILLPSGTKLANRRGETGVAQVRLEMVASVLAQTEQLLLEAPQVPVDEDALVAKAAEQACGGCPCRKNCKDCRKISLLPGAILHKPLLSPEELPVVCRKSGRFLAQLHRAQEQLRSIHADRMRQQEYRTAVVQQYRFLSEYLQELSDGLANKTQTITAAYRPCVRVYANRPAPDNGDRCVMFAGTGCRYYVLMCDGMGTGIGAVQEGKAATEMLRRLLSAGYPARCALQSLNSLCALRNRAGIVTVELLEIRLDTGRAVLYKWGAAPSYVVSAYGTEKIGTAVPPPGLSLTEYREAVYQLSLRRGELLLLVSDGIGQEEALQCCMENTGAAPGELARRLLDRGQRSGEDDATVVTVCLDRE